MNVSVVERSPDLAPSSALTTRSLPLGAGVADEEWDAFLLSIGGGSHLQSTGWARSKESVHWRAARVIVRCDGQIRAGAQLLFRRLGPLGSVGYVARGPVLMDADPMLAREVLGRLLKVARHHRVHYLVVQPPAGGEWLIPHLIQHQFSSGLVRPHPPCTVLVDVSGDEEAMLGRMRGSMRRNVRLAQRRGVRVVRGTYASLPEFHRLLDLTGSRQHFAVPGLRYFQRLWAHLEPRDEISLLFAVCDDVPVSAGLYIRFGDTLTYKRGAWSGSHGGLHPNELLHWEAMRWAKAQGCRYYDMDGIEERVAARLAARKGLTEDDRHTVAHFKLGLGGEIVWTPGAYDLVLSPILRRAFGAVRYTLQDSGVAQTLEALARRL